MLKSAKYVNGYFICYRSHQMCYPLQRANSLVDPIEENITALLSSVCFGWACSINMYPFARSIYGSSDLLTTSIVVPGKESKRSEELIIINVCQNASCTYMNGGIYLLFWHIAFHILIVNESKWKTKNIAGKVSGRDVEKSMRICVYWNKIWKIALFIGQSKSFNWIELQLHAAKL